jgi:hypothetical protein
MHDQSITIPLSQGKVATIDAEDAALVSQYRWHAKRGYATCYAVTNVTDSDGKRRQLPMHRLIMGDPPGKDIHHKSGDGLDNRHRNLESLTRGENNQHRIYRRDPYEWTPKERDEQTVTLTGDGRALIGLVGENGRGKYAIVDAADLPLVQEYRWNIAPAGDQHTYAIAYERTMQRNIYLHRLIMQPPEGYVVDHRDGDGKHGRLNFPDGTPAPYVPRDAAMNTNNTSGYRGVQRGSGTRWRAIIRMDGTNRNLGFYATPEEAARAYDAKARELFGDKARLNFPD